MFRRLLLCLVALLVPTLFAVTAGPAFAIDRDADTGSLAVSEDPPAQALLPSDLTDTIATSGTCSASLDCGDGNTVSCQGTSSCQTTFAGVKCDGQEVQCPNFCSVGIQCSCGLAICWSTSGNCTQSPPTCDGRLLRCHCPFSQ